MRRIRCLKLVQTSISCLCGGNDLLNTGVGFLPDILQILQALPPKNKKKWQGMCFSATFPPKIKDVLSCILSPGYTSISTVDPSESPTIAGVPQCSVVIPTVADTFAALLSLIKHEISASTAEPKIIVFGTTANLVRLYAKLFEGQTELRVFELHSRLSQPKRTQTTSDFKAAKNGIIFATDGTLAPFTTLYKPIKDQLIIYCSDRPRNGFPRCFPRGASWSPFHLRCLHASGRPYGPRWQGRASCHSSHRGRVFLFQSQPSVPY